MEVLDEHGDGVIGLDGSVACSGLSGNTWCGAEC